MQKGTDRDGNCFDDQENVVPPPDFLTAFTFNGGLLSSFRKEEDAYEFIEAYYELEELSSDKYKKVLVTSNNKNKWLSLINYTKRMKRVVLYDGKRKTLFTYENEFLLSLIKQMYKCFGELFFRLLDFHNETKSITFQVTSNTLFQD